ncbi:unnamed protein product [Orchesella dallaii]|uniref:CRAL-TRIO domain-containing protein n=1 Tax=Orchesella dallaii TaxID=48710 RepID=A0ABP1QW80_9HEXA
MIRKIFHLCVLIVSLCQSISVVHAVSFEEDISLSTNQAEILTKFRQRVLPMLPKKYMEENIYLIRWLRARNFNMDRAEEMLRQHLKWRSDNQLDQIDDEEWQDFETDYPLNKKGLDKNGRPLVQILFGEWDLRKAAVTGRTDRLIRWIYKYFEDATKLVRKYQADGKNVTQFTLIMDADGFSTISHACPLCMRVYFAISNIYEEHYPGSVDKIHIVNTPEPFRVIVRLLWPLLSQNTRQAINMMGTNRREWQSQLTKNVKTDQLLPSFGGTLYQ